MESYAAGIVLYNPDIDRLKENLEAVSQQVKLVYCYNNGLKDEREISKLLSNYTNVCMVGYGENVGIATALNKLMRRAKEDGIEWILTLDQDSVVCKNMVEELALLKSEKSTTIICPLVKDERRKNETPVIASCTIEDVDFCITSGSFMNVEKTLEIGGLDDRLFIGLVDNEICYRMKLNGYRIVRNNSVILNHQLGNLTPSKFEKLYLKLGEFLHSKTIKKLSYRREVNPMRLYYATRNMVYLNRKYKGENVPAWSLRSMIKNSISSILRGKHKLKLIESIYAGIQDGKKESMQGKVIL